MVTMQQGLLPLAVLLAITVSAYGAGIVHKKQWFEDEKIWIQADVTLTALCDLSEWSVILKFADNPLKFETWNALNGDTCINSQQCELKNKWPVNLKNGDKLVFPFQAFFDRKDKPEINAEWGAVCGKQPPTGNPPTNKPPTNKPPTNQPPTNQPTTNQPPTNQPPTPVTPGKYNYGQVLSKSILFYEAQRSGKLPGDNRIPYRGDSGMNDGRDVGRDLTGGWYDAGDHVKFNFPMASSVTLLAMGMLRYKAGYESAGEWQNALNSIKCPLEYFIKCHASKNELYVQCGDGHADHAWWGRPEEMSMNRPSYKVNSGKPGSDVAGEMAAAMAAGYLLFKDSDAGFAGNLLRHAKEVYTFAKTYKGKYSDSVPQVRSFYNSNGYMDELAWSAAWLHKATGEQGYLQDAKSVLSQLGTPGELSWDDKSVTAALLVLEADSSDSSAKNMVNGFVTNWLNSVKRTPKGLAWLRKWGPNRYAANAAFVLMVAGDMGIESGRTLEFATKQINYMLGDGGRSYVCGFGNNPPQRPHHKASSCPWRPAPCGWNEFNSGSPNPHVLYGALVGGPGENDDYDDRRNDYVKNEVATDYNAAFQSTLAGLVTKYK